MAYFIFGLALGTFISALISMYYEGDHRWVSPSLLFGLSGLLFLTFLYLGWPMIKEIFA